MLVPPLSPTRRSLWAVAPVALTVCWNAAVPAGTASKTVAMVACDDDRTDSLEMH
jgi:hypothetical protein